MTTVSGVLFQTPLALLYKTKAVAIPVKQTNGSTHACCRFLMPKTVLAEFFELIEQRVEAVHGGLHRCWRGHVDPGTTQEVDGRFG